MRRELSRRTAWGETPWLGAAAAQGNDISAARPPYPPLDVHRVWSRSDECEIFASRAAPRRGRGGELAAAERRLLGQTSTEGRLVEGRVYVYPNNFFITRPICTKLHRRGTWVHEVPPAKFEANPTTFIFSSTGARGRRRVARLSHGGLPCATRRRGAKPSLQGGLPCLGKACDKAYLP